MDRCVELQSYGDGSFYTRQSLNNSQRPTFTFYTTQSCRGTALATISPLSDGEIPVANNLIITINDFGATQVNSADPITEPGKARPKKNRATILEKIRETPAQQTRTTRAIRSRAAVR